MVYTVCSILLSINCVKKYYCTECQMQTHFSHIEIGPLLGVAQGEMLKNSAEFVCRLACFSPNVHCKLSTIAIDGIKCELTPNYTTSSISGSSNSYDYPTQKIIIYDLTSGNRYNYCVTGVSVSDDEIVDVGEPICGTFTTSTARSENDGMYIFL